MLMARSGRQGVGQIILSLGAEAAYAPGTGVVTGAGVSSWPDWTGKGHPLLQGTDAARPALQADGSILFNGTSHFLKTAAFTLNQPTTVVLVVKQVSWTTGEDLIDGETLLSGAIQTVTSSPLVRLRNGGVGGATVSPAVGVTGVLTAVWNGASSSLTLNRGTPTADNMATDAMGGLTLGAGGGGAAGTFTNIQVYEAAIFPSALSAADRARVASALMAAHGIT